MKINECWGYFPAAFEPQPSNRRIFFILIYKLLSLVRRLSEGCGSNAAREYPHHSLIFNLRTRDKQLSGGNLFYHWLEGCGSKAVGEYPQHSLIFNIRTRDNLFIWIYIYIYFYHWLEGCGSKAAGEYPRHSLIYERLAATSQLSLW